MYMRKINSWLIALALAISFVTGAAAQTSGEKEERQRTAEARADISGTWLVNLNLGGASATSTQAAPQPATARTQAPFIAVEVFHADGTFTETSLTDFLPPQGPPGQGLWERVGQREFALTIYGVTVGDLTNPQFLGTYKVRSRLTLNRAGNEFSGPFTIEIYDPSGNLVSTFEGTAQGRRARVDPLP